MSASVTVIDHPLLQHKLTLMRKKGTSTAEFRRLLIEIGGLLAYEVTRDLPLRYEEIETPVAWMEAPMIEGRKLVLVAILRAGMGMLDGMLAMIPSARVGHVGMVRDPETFMPKEYYFKLPGHLEDREVIVVDPMLATAGTAISTLHRVRQAKPRSMKFVCLVAAPEGIAALQKEHPDVPIYTVAIDSNLNDHAYIVPGLGDAGDRIFGTCR
ncbi:MAG: uracil phosphoribosyltransferase [Proteobacteria bacterium]|jgi:uracil phosphoribosyltransferase|nr:uracil phosphoribosyltransferase [Pseudomonadota bacterium]